MAAGMGGVRDSSGAFTPRGKVPVLDVAWATLVPLAPLTAAVSRQASLPVQAQWTTLTQAGEGAVPVRAKPQRPQTTGRNTMCRERILSYVIANGPLCFEVAPAGT